MAESRSLRALMTNLIDYAGLFPPAKLDMQPTVRNYAAYLHGEDEWMLGRLIVPVSRLDEFEREAGALLSKDGDAEPWLISALTAPAGDAAFAADLDRIASFNDRHAVDGAALIDVIEVKAASAGAIDAALDVIPDDLFAFFELPVTNDPRGLIAVLPGSDAGAKIRTGGVTADAYPSPERVARFIRACAAAGVPFKATAGLHHPLRHRNEAVGTDEFGFLGVFLGACFAAASDFEERDLIALLCEEDAGAFKFDDGGVTWRGRPITTEHIEKARERSAIAFGSCSFDEPLEDLRALKLL